MTRVRLIIATLSALVVVLVVGVTFDSILIFRQAATSNNFHTFLVESCTRLNILRAEDNISHYADYHVFRIVLTESRASAPPPGQTRQEKRFASAFLNQLAQAVAAKQWTPLTDCAKAVNREGVAYRAPHPIRFVDRLPAPHDLRFP